MLTSIDQLPAVTLADAVTARPGVVDLWCFFYQGLDEDAEGRQLLASYAELMTEAERARHDRFYFARDRLLFLATRALVRTVLSHYAPIAPASWRFGGGERGKPYIAESLTTELAARGDAAIHFNLTNTLGLVVCAVSRAHAALGVDAESLERAGETLSIADHYFSPREVRALRALPPNQQRERFFSYWTLKESYIKARGLGLAIPLEQFSFLLDGEDGNPPLGVGAGGGAGSAGGGIRIAFDPRLGDDAAGWRFALLRGGPSHLIAVGANTGGAPLVTHAVRYLPLRGIVPWTLPAEPGSP